jgi:hypothetical protein
MTTQRHSPCAARVDAEALDTLVLRPEGSLVLDVGSRTPPAVVRARRQGLLEAAKTVAAMAAPVTTAVKAVLALLG